MPMVTVIDLLIHLLMAIDLRIQRHFRWLNHWLTVISLQIHLRLPKLTVTNWQIHSRWRLPMAINSQTVMVWNLG
jgi:hypothetical protein